LGTNRKTVSRDEIMRILISDWANLDAVLSIVETYRVGIEIQEYASPDNIDHHRSMAIDIRE
jgi:hypothetical protein